MHFIVEAVAAVDDALAACAGAGGVAALDDEARDEAVEDGAVVVAVEAVLEEVAGGEGGLLGEELEGEVAGGGCEDYFGCWWGFKIVCGRHGSVVVGVV